MEPGFPPGGSGASPAVPRRREVHRLQRRRRRPGGLHGSERPGRESPPGPGGDAHRSLRHRSPEWLHLCPGRISLWPSSICKMAIEQAEELGLLGDHILGSHFSFHVKIKEGAGAFVCGEETALLASIEGKRGMPRARPPFPAVAGLWGKPTNINNVETYANIRSIILEGASGLCLRGNGGVQGNEDLFPHRQDQQHRPGGGSHGDNPARGHLQDRRRNPQRPSLQGGPDGRALGRVPAARGTWTCPSTMNP